MHVRLPRAVTALVAGAALGIAGLQMQTLFRNPLADPYVLGVSSGASLGVALVVLAGAGSSATVFAGSIGLLGDVTIAGAAILGAVAVLALILPISARLVSPATILIVGLNVRVRRVGIRHGPRAPGGLAPAAAVDRVGASGRSPE